MAQLWRAIWVSVAAMAALGSSASAQDCDGWVPVGDPGWRQQAGTVYDPVRGVTVLFGGGRQVGNSSGEHIYADTWTHDGRRWMYVSTPTAPTAKLNALMAFDPVSGRTLLHGGRATNNGASESATWSFDGTNWAPFATGGPSVLATGAVFAWDGAAGAHWCSVPTAGAMRLWRLAGGLWTEVLPAEGQLWPGANTGGLGAFDSVRNRLVVFAYATGEVWEWDGVAGAWSVTPGVFAPTTSFGLIRFADAPALGGVMFVQGGLPRVWTGAQLVTLALPTVPNSSTHATQNAFTFPDGTPGLVGEFTGNIGPNNAGTLRVMRIESAGYTVKAGRPAPTSRALASVAAYPARGTMLVGGSTDVSGSCPGGTPGATYFGDTWLLRGERWQQLAAAGVGTPYNAPLVYDPAEGTMVFPTHCSIRAGGTSTRSARWDGAAWQPWAFATTTPQPGQSGYNASAVDAATGRVWVLTQGANSLTARQAGATGWTNLGAPSGAPFQQYGTLAFDPVRNALVHTGQNTAQPTLAYNLGAATWTLIQNSPSSGPVPYPGRWAPASAYDPGRSAVVVFGGFNHHDLSQSAFPRRTYLLPSASNAWQQIVTTNVPGRKFMNIAYEPLSERIVMFGGDNFNMMGDTWKLARGPARVAVPPAPLTAEAGGTAVLEVVAKGGGAIRYQWRRDNVPLVENARIDGVNTDLLIVTGLLGSDAGDYTCVVTNDCGTETTIAAHLTVTGAACAADVGSAGGEEGPDGQLDNNDFIVFVNWFFEADERADMGSAGGVASSDGAFDNNDFIALIDYFFTPC